MDALFILVIFFALLFVGMPVAYTLGLTAISGAIFLTGDFSMLSIVMLKMGDGVNKFSLLSIPFFVLAGTIMAEGGIAVRLINFASIFVGFVRGGLSLVNILASTFFGAISGSSVADTATIGSVMIPQMEKHGYPRHYSAAVTAAGSVQATLVPPSHNSVIYSLATGGMVPIGALFLAGVIPGLLLGLTLMTLCLYFAKTRNYPKGEAVELRQAFKIMLDAIPGLLTVVIILGGILSGWYTATESAAMACVWAFVITMFYYRDYKWSQLPILIHRTVKTVTIVMILIGFASAFGHILTMMSIPLKISTFFTSISDNPVVILLAINVLLLLLGTLMDMAPLILILTPILLPVVTALGVHPVHFGMLMMVNLGMGLITPPVGTVLFVASAVSGQKMEKVAKSMVPFFLALFCVLMAVTFIPQLSLWLPKVAGEINNPPKLTADVATTSMGSELNLNVLSNDTDREGNRITLKAASLEQGAGEVNYSPKGMVTYTPEADFTGEAIIRYRATDYVGGEEESTLTITVN